MQAHNPKTTNTKHSSRRARVTEITNAQLRAKRQTSLATEQKLLKYLKPENIQRRVGTNPQMPKDEETIERLMQIREVLERAHDIYVDKLILWEFRDLPIDQAIGYLENCEHLEAIKILLGQ